jgi:hypothetical protein
MVGGMARTIRIEFAGAFHHAAAERHWDIAFEPFARKSNPA